MIRDTFVFPIIPYTYNERSSNFRLTLFVLNSCVSKFYTAFTNSNVLFVSIRGTFILFPYSLIHRTPDPDLLILCLCSPTDTVRNVETRE